MRFSIGKNPGPHGFYDDLGNPGHQPHLVKGIGWESDPDFFSSSMNRVEDRFSFGTACRNPGGPPPPAL